MGVEETLRVEILGSQHDRSAFDSGVEPLDRYFRVQAGQDARKNMAAPFVLVLADGTVAGYYTLSSMAVNLGDLPEKIVRKLPRYPLLPATLLGRLAVDRHHQGKGFGRFLLADALFRAVKSEIASFAVIVDAKDDIARRFYERESFLPFPDQPMKLFRPMVDIELLFK
ncbi:MULTISPECIES: GNAT family N-acetyltransferase [Rhizobium]|uniref:Acetyltransferase n=1 Tax=Rhizobium favelukesii TaxID=348824 RepID=W6RNN5_9HYPH|nr:MULTISPECIES: GNAT family N-acetyltransferase [Rhizobium]MCS0463612.1 GNAT family N-acetyltransferase [Rhizobium favelukesii]UFS84880.1 GNAT family N-acetyltransferase [Rhizobium sp. T136]CDM60453.1 acetyltransferase [Rhizobium favelukesii]